MNNEYIIWGKQSGNDKEEILYSKATSQEQAELWIKRLVSLYGVKDTRIQIIDFKTPINFIETIII
jgi:hypothetical protein